MKPRPLLALSAAVAVVPVSAAAPAQAQQRADMKAMAALITAGQKVQIQPNAIEGR